MKRRVVYVELLMLLIVGDVLNILCGQYTRASE